MAGRDEDARHARRRRGAIDQHAHAFGELLRIDVARVALAGHQHRGRRETLTLLVAERVTRTGGQPDVDIEADLMRSVAGGHRTATRPAHVTDEDAGPAILRSGFAQPLDEADELGRAPAPVARRAHRLEVIAVGGQLLRAREASLGVAADRDWRAAGGRVLRAEELRRWRIGQRRSCENEETDHDGEKTKHHASIVVSCLVDIKAASTSRKRVPGGAEQAVPLLAGQRDVGAGGRLRARAPAWWCRARPACSPGAA